MFRGSSAHLQEDTVVYMQHMVLSLSMRVPGDLSVHSVNCVPTCHHELWQYHTLNIYNCILLKMSNWGSKHIQENNILWINNNQCIKLVIITKSIHDARSEKYQVVRIYVCLFSCRYNPLWLYFHSPVTGFSLLFFEVSWSHTTTRHNQ